MQLVVIIGGGPVGLVSSILLSLQKIPHVLFERHASTSIHPKACGLNQRTVEIFRHIGVEADILRQGAPRDTYSRTGWYTSFGSDGREIHSRDAWGGGQYRAAFEAASPSPYVMLPQIRLEPILQRRALELNPDGIKYATEVVKIDEKADRVIVTVQKADGTQYEVESQYVLGADGGRMVTDWLGIAWEGEREIFDMVSAHFRAPISQSHPDSRNFISWFINPETGGSIKSGYMYHLGPYPIDASTEEWYFGCAMLPDDPERFDTESTIRRIHRTLNMENLNIELLSVSHWFVSSIVAERFRSRLGKVFLVGDAAHRIPPWGALGVNTGVQDAFNLVWKLSFVLQGRVDPTQAEQLLNSYDEERRPIAQRVAKSSLLNLKSHAGAMDKAIGLSQELGPIENQIALNIAMDTAHPDYAQIQLGIEQAQRVLDSEFGAHGTEVGWFYPSADIKQEGAKTRHAGQIKEDGAFDELIYHPSTIPGHHLPHAWLQNLVGDVPVSTRDLIVPDKLLLLTQDPHEWQRVQNENPLVKVEVINNSVGWIDLYGSWARICDVGKEGAVLIRPDGIVAWRGRVADSQLHNLLSSFVAHQRPVTSSL
ncbi:uncharacterized protein BHQ10_004169 [Talaromyces amestolkiae]|uniref:FAD-binding domain-containing protein n=1 Tax=Talaromyces amestolkiae TaxID=1196081 RepID=A0A364KX77_TALAM|nr:uncharacterized protein BHQ10_004169 [Talaromyces amestolkiae]RAO68157.1 hypothetical protein BHQ10_004169 [Talaromyces amestolkiae]